jgi:hypothetical protein
MMGRGAEAADTAQLKGRSAAFSDTLHAPRAGHVSQLEPDMPAKIVG